MFYTVYKTTNLINGKIYVGLHITNNLEDDYLGSGSQLKSAIKKYGKENFKRDYIKICNSPEEMYELEADIVNEDFVKRSDTYNMKTGGTGSWYHVNSNPAEKSRTSSIGGVKTSSRDTNPFKDPEWQKQYEWTRSPEILKANSIKANSPDAIAKKKATWKETGRGQGSKNSQYGTCWVTHSELGNKKISKDDLDKFLTLGYTKGRKIRLYEVN
jgi:hypothetical protein